MFDSVGETEFAQRHPGLGEFLEFQARALRHSYADLLLYVLRDLSIELSHQEIFEI
jgi:hypothetical protein